MDPMQTGLDTSEKDGQRIWEKEDVWSCRHCPIKIESRQDECSFKGDAGRQGSKRKNCEIEWVSQRSRVSGIIINEWGQ